MLVACFCSRPTSLIFVTRPEFLGDWSAGALPQVAAAVNVLVATKDDRRMVSHSTDIHREFATMFVEWEELRHETVR